MEVETSIMETLSQPKRYFPKPGRGLAGKKVKKTPVQPVLPADNGQSAASGTPPTLAETQTQIANRLFRERAEKIADAEVRIHPGENEWEPIYLILVPEFRSEAFNKIVKLRGDLYRKYPDSILNVELRGRRELSECPVTDILIS